MPDMREWTLAEIAEKACLVCGNSGVANFDELEVRCKVCGTVKIPRNPEWPIVLTNLEKFRR